MSRRRQLGPGQWWGLNGERCWGRNDIPSVEMGRCDGAPVSAFMADPKMSARGYLVRDTFRVGEQHDLMSDLNQILSLSIFAESDQDWSDWTLDVKRQSKKTARTGTCYDQRKLVRVNVWPGRSPGSCRLTLLHEMIHACGWMHHDRSFRHVNLRAARALGWVNPHFTTPLLNRGHRYEFSRILRSEITLTLESHPPVLMQPMDEPNEAIDIVAAIGWLKTLK